LKTRLSFLAVTLLVFMLPSSSEARVSVPEKAQIPIFMKILAYDRTLDERAGNQVHIGVIYSDRNDPEFGENLSKVLDALSENLGREIKGLPVVFSVVKLDSPEQLARQLQEREIDIVYLTCGLQEDLPGIVEVTRRLDVLTLASEIVYLKSGAALGLHLIKGRPKIFINLKASRQEGACFSANILKLCTIVGD
jgi:hypothetical protein